MEEAIQTLRAALLKKNEEQYIRFFEEHRMTLEIKLHRVRIYMKQLKHDLCLKEIDNIKAIVSKKPELK